MALLQRTKTIYTVRTLALACWLATGAVLASTAPAPVTGVPGGSLVVALRAEPRTFNPLTAVDAPSRAITQRLMGDLVRINRATLATEPNLAESFTASPDGRVLTAQLRAGLRFSDGSPCDADDVVFSFRAYLDARVGAAQRELLMVGGQPPVVRKIGARTIQVEFAAPYAVGERLFDGLAVLPAKRLAAALAAGTLGAAWGLTTPPDQIVGLGPFRLKRYVPGERVELERNPYYWRADGAGRRLPYLESLVFAPVQSEQAQILWLRGGRGDLVDRISAASAATLSRAADASRWTVRDVGPGLEYSFLLLNQNPLPAGATPTLAARRRWFTDRRFRQAVSSALDREALVRLAYVGRAVPLVAPFSPGNREWVAPGPAPRRDLDRAARLLVAMGLTRNRGGRWQDGNGEVVGFTIATSAGNAARQQMATLIQADLDELGFEVQVVPLEFRALVDRVTRSFDYDAAVMSLASGDADPNGDIDVWLSSGGSHLWRPGQAAAATPWEAEIDRLMHQQLSTRDVGERRRAFARVQEIAAAELPLIGLAAPRVLVAAASGLRNLRPGILDHVALWNSDELYWDPAARPVR